MGVTLANSLNRFLNVPDSLLARNLPRGGVVELEGLLRDEERRCCFWRLAGGGAVLVDGAGCSRSLDMALSTLCS